MMENINGVINIYKEKNFTSHDVVNIVRKNLGKIKTGHTGTLDPGAEGVLPICVGKATKISEYIASEIKEYIAEVVLGVTTDTLDTSGQILTTMAVCLDENTIQNAVDCFKGELLQTPPMYSAIKIQGKKLYELARKGIEVERQKRLVNIYSIEILDFTSPERFKIKVQCSKGTYIRSLCDDIGQKLQTGACMGELTRTRSGNFYLENSIKIETFKKIVQDGDLSNILLPIDMALLKLKKVTVKNEMNKFLLNGNKINFKYVLTSDIVDNEEKLLVYNEDKLLIGVFAFNKAGYFIKPITMLL